MANKIFTPSFENSTTKINTESSEIKKEESDDENHDPTFIVETEVGEEDFKIDTSKVKKELVELESFLEQDGKVDLDKPHKCTLCDARYAKNFHLKRHIETVHEGLKPHKCSICNKGFAELCNLKHHIATVHEGKRPHQCTICGKRFAKNNQLNMHVETVHEGKKPFACTECDMQYQTSKGLKKHIQGTHLRCSICKIDFDEISDCWP